VAVTLIDSCSIANAGSASQSVATGIGQSFTGNGSQLTSCSFYLRYSITPLTGTLYATLYAHTGTYGTSGKPTGPILASSKSVNCSLVTDTDSLINFGFVGAQRVTPVNGTKYVIVLVHIGDASGNRCWARRTDASAHAGNGSYKDTNWIVIPAGIDFIFYVFSGDPVDVTPPVITLTGSATVNLTVGATYLDDGATATDDIDGNMTAAIATVNSVNTAVAGVYTVTYNVNDLSGNPALEVVRTVNVSLAVSHRRNPFKIFFMKGGNQ